VLNALCRRLDVYFCSFVCFLCPSDDSACQSSTVFNMQQLQKTGVSIKYRSDFGSYSKTCLKRNVIVAVIFFRFQRFPFYTGLCSNKTKDNMATIGTQESAKTWDSH
jgi:hypothetical protein